MLIATDGGFGTVSSSLIALPADENQEVMPRYLFAAGRPDPKLRAREPRLIKGFDLVVLGRTD